MITIAGDFLGNIFFLDNRFFISLKYLLSKPGEMTVEFLEGKRKKFLSPVTLFLFVNLIYFFITPLTDYSLPLRDQIKYQPYSNTAKIWVEQKIEEQEISYESYASRYNRTSDNISKTVMILNVPFIALFVHLFSFKRRKFYFDSFIFSLHFFSFFLISICFGTIVNKVTSYLGFAAFANYQDIWFAIFLFTIPLLYLIVSYRKFTRNKWWLVTVVSPFLFAGMAISQGVYRLIIFLLTFFFT